jgi:uncharacterized protein (DUF983 family)
MKLMTEEPALTAAPMTFSTAFTRGLACRCPQCGTGKMFASFLKVAEHCPHCGEELSHHRADDMPAYLVILITGHIVVPLAAIMEIKYGWPYWLHALIWLPVCLGLGIGLLQPIKGAVVAIQWYHDMHGFALSKAQRIEKSASISASPKS